MPGTRWPWARTPIMGLFLPPSFSVTFEAVRVTRSLGTDAHGKETQNAQKTQKAAESAPLVDKLLPASS